MKTLELKKQIKAVYELKGLNGLYSFLKRNGVKYNKNIVEFGLDTNKETFKDKKDWLNEKTDNDTFRFHYYSVSITHRKTKYIYNLVRGMEIKINIR